jgi:hypothetical protein
MKKKAQVTIFIILAIVIIVTIVLLFYLMRGPGIDDSSATDPKSAVQKCVRDVVDESIDKMLFNGGEIFPTQTISYRGDEWNYLCYQADLYLGCYNIHPMLKLQIEKQIVSDTEDEVERCFDSVMSDFRSRNYDIESGDLDYSVELESGFVSVNLNRRLDISKNGESSSFEDFETRVVSPINDLVDIAREVVNSEAQFCYFEYNGFMLLYPEYEIRRIDYFGSKLYRLIDRRTGDEFRFAVRSCAMEGLPEVENE